MITTEALVVALILFALRIANNAIGTVRLLMLAQQRRLLTAILGCFEALTFAITIAGVVTDLTNILNLAAYSLGFGVGAYLGMWLEARLFVSYMAVQVFTSAAGHDAADALRTAGFAVTETFGMGRDGRVSILRSVIVKRDVSRYLALAQKLDPDAFIEVDEARAIYQGWMRRPGSLAGRVENES